MTSTTSTTMITGGRPMYVCLLFPPGTDARNPHLSLPSLAAFLANSVKDLVALSKAPSLNLFERFYEEQLFPSLEQDRPDLIGISILNFQQVIPGLMLARGLRSRGHFVVLGGTVYTKFVPELLQR